MRKYFMKYWKDINLVLIATVNLVLTGMKVKVKRSLYRPRQALRAVGD
jgi:hypothetical protein